MAFVKDREFLCKLLDDYAVNAWRRSVACEDPQRGVPHAMQVGEIDDEGWVEWQMLPSTLDETDVATFEAEFDVQFPPKFRAYLTARFHLFDQVQSKRYDQQIVMSDTPLGRPLKPLRTIMTAWQPLITAGFVPFAEWGDAWGPLCFDLDQRDATGECPIVWMDHEELTPLALPQCRNRDVVLPLAKPLYGSCHEFLIDVFGTADIANS